MSPERGVMLAFFASVVIFFVTHVALFRLEKFRTTVYRTLLAFIICWLFALGTGLLMLEDYGKPWPLNVQWVLFGSFAMLSTAFAAWYVLVIYQTLDSSLHVLLLREIAAKRNGITAKELDQKFSRETVLRRRLTRLVAAGELVVAGGRYRLVPKTFSLLRLREALAVYVMEVFA